MKRGYFYIADKTHNGKKLGLIFVLNIGDGRILKLSTLKYICKDNSILVVFTPVSSSEAGVLKKQLKRESLVHKTFDTQICKLLGEIISGKLKPNIGAGMSRNFRFTVISEWLYKEVYLIKTVRNL